MSGSMATRAGVGVIIDKRGYIVTNDHVGFGASTIQVTLFHGTMLSAKLTGTDALTIWLWSNHATCLWLTTGPAIHPSSKLGRSAGNWQPSRHSRL